MRTVIGENSDAEYQLVEKIGSGAQGQVFSVKGGKYAVKIIGKKSSINAQHLKRKISYVKTRNISDLNISQPIEQIKGEYLGYIMEMATDMIPLEDLLKPKANLDWWINTGGLKKRLLVLKNLSKLLADLHSRGLIYGDLSPKNIFISIDKDSAEVYLIDADNITHESKVGNAFYTPGYGAPEIVRGSSGADTYTDNYSFSVIAYQLLTLNHPFIGDYINFGEPELEEEAYMGKIPWVEHTHNTINRSTKGLASSIVISKKLMNEFINSFEINHLNKYKRTTASKWNEIFIRSLTQVLQCCKCNNTFFYNQELCCPFCDEKKDSIGVIEILQRHAIIKEQLKHQYPLLDLNIHDTSSVINRKIGPVDTYISITENDLFLNKSESVLFKIKIGPNNHYIKGVNQAFITVYTNNQIKENISIENEIKVLHGDWFIFSKNPQEEYQRVIKVRVYNRWK